MKHAKLLSALLVFAMIFALLVPMTLTGCSKKEKVLIYTSVEDYVIEDMNKRLGEVFPNYDVKVEYLGTGEHYSKLVAEGTQTDCDITYDLEYAYMADLAAKGYLADLSAYNRDIYVEDAKGADNYLVQCRVGGAVILNTQVLKEKGLPEPTSYEDLLDSKYEGLISMPHPEASGTGYMFYKNLVNTWGEEKALDYFSKLSKNVLQFTDSGSKPVNSLKQKEVAIGFGMTSQAVKLISEGTPLKIVYFEEGSPYTLYGQSIIKGKEERTCVKEVFDFLVNTYSRELNQKFFPEQMFTDSTPTLENYPANIRYGDMSGNTTENKTRLLKAWNDKIGKAGE